MSTAAAEELGGPGLYLHLPFCSAICPYCDYYVLPGDREMRRRFVDRLAAEMRIAAAGIWLPSVAAPPAEPFDTLYLGGGTPSRLGAGELERLLAAARRHLPLANDLLIHMEANPEDVAAESLAAWRRLGVETLSLGVQSFAADNLRFLGRQHGARQAVRACELAREADFRTLSLDLIFALPGQTPGAWRRELERALDLEADHLSCYELTVHPRTPFGFRRAGGRLAELPEERRAELLLFTHRFLEDHGYEAYEVSNFAAGSAHRSRHNLKYWRRVPYLGLGPSAHSFAGRHRWWNVRKIRPYAARIDAGERPLGGAEELADEAVALEHLALGLRTREGVDFRGLPVPEPLRLWRRNSALIACLTEGGLARAEDHRLQPTARGMALADGLARSFDLSPLVPQAEETAASVLPDRPVIASARPLRA